MFLLSGVKRGPSGLGWLPGRRHSSRPRGRRQGHSAGADPVRDQAPCPLDRRRCCRGLASMRPGPSGRGPRGHSWSSSCFCAAPCLPCVVLPAFSFPLGGGGQQLPKGWLGLATALRATYGPQLILRRATCPSLLPPPAHWPDGGRSEGPPRSWSRDSGRPRGGQSQRHRSCGRQALPFALPCGRPAFVPLACAAASQRAPPLVPPAADRPALMCRLLRECRAAESSSGLFRSLLIPAPAATSA